MKALRFSNLKYYIMLHFIVLIWGFTGILGKLIDLDFYKIVFFRMLIAGITLLGYLLITKQPFRIRDKRTALKVVGVGLIVLLHWLTFFKAIQISTASLGVLCLATTALHVSWLEPMIMKRKFSYLEFTLGICVIFGVIFVSQNIHGNHFAGLFWGLISAFLSACFAVFNARLNKDGLTSSVITVHEMLVGALVLFLWLGLRGKIDTSFFVMSLSDFNWLLFLGIVCTAMAFMLMINIVNRIGAYSATLTINLEPVYSILLAILILSEDDLLGKQFYFGVLFIIAVVFANPLLKKYLTNRTRKRRIKLYYKSRA